MALLKFKCDRKDPAVECEKTFDYLFQFGNKKPKCPSCGTFKVKQVLAAPKNYYRPTRAS